MRVQQSLPMIGKGYKEDAILATHDEVVPLPVDMQMKMTPTMKMGRAPVART